MVIRGMHINISNVEGSKYVVPHYNFLIQKVKLRSLLSSGLLQKQHYTDY